MKKDKIYLLDANTGLNLRAIVATECGRPNITSRWNVHVIKVNNKTTNYYYYYSNPKFWYLVWEDRWYKISISEHPIVPYAVVTM